MQPNSTTTISHLYHHVYGSVLMLKIFPESVETYTISTDITNTTISKNNLMPVLPNLVASIEARISTQNHAILLRNVWNILATNDNMRTLSNAWLLAKIPLYIPTLTTINFNSF